MRNILLALLVVNVAFSIFAYPLYSFASGAGQLYVMSGYRGLVIDGVIHEDEVAMKSYKGGSLFGDSLAVPEYLNEGAFRYTDIAALILTGAFALNSVLIAVALANYKRDSRCSESDSSTSS